MLLHCGAFRSSCFWATKHICVVLAGVPSSSCLLRRIYIARCTYLSTGKDEYSLQRVFPHLIRCAAHGSLPKHDFAFFCDVPDQTRENIIYPPPVLHCLMGV